MSDADALRRAMTMSLLIFIVSLVFLTLGWRHLPREEANRIQRARELGEPIQETG